jgi:hypothetical protein
VFDPNEPVQLIAFGETVDFSMPVLVQTTRDIIRDPDVQRAAALIGKDVHPIIVVAHASRKKQRCFASLNMTENSHCCHSERSEESRIILGKSGGTQSSEMFESLASCFAFRCSAALNMTGMKT